VDEEGRSMSEKEKKISSKPLLYIVQPNILEPEIVNMQKEFRSKKTKIDDLKTEVDQVETTETAPEYEVKVESEDREEKQRKEQQFEQMKHDFGVYKAMDEIHAEIDSIKQITDHYSPEGTSIIKENIPVANGGGVHEIKKLEPKSVEELQRKAVRKAVKDLLRKTEKGVTPLCEAKINGRIVRFQLLGKRGESVQIKTGSTIQNVQIVDLSDFKIL
jgi:cysteinyl-tRNA synthetase